MHKKPEAFPHMLIFSSALNRYVGVSHLFYERGDRPTPILAVADERSSLVRSYL